MDVRSQSQSGAILSLSAQLAAVPEQLVEQQQLWRERLLREPARFGEIEVAVHHAFQQWADQVVAGLLAEVGQQPVLETASKKSR